MNTTKLKKIILEVESDQSIFRDKSRFDTLARTDRIIGRENKAKEIVRHLVGIKKGFAPPLISIYGKSGNGKSLVTKFVVENFDGISHCFVNLRKAKTVFGAANLILYELGQKGIDNAKSLNEFTIHIGRAIQKKLKKEKKRAFVLVLDEVDIIFNDKRGNPSDFFYKLLVLEETLKEKGFLVSIITISNYLFSSNKLDDRVLSRIGSHEIVFEPYSEDDILNILQHVSKKGLARKTDRKILSIIARGSSINHGDARRAIDLLRKSAEIAGASNEKISVEHVGKAFFELDRDNVSEFISSAPIHLKSVFLSIAEMSFVSGEPWQATSTIYKTYCSRLDDDYKPLSYRRISSMLGDLEQSGLVVSRSAAYGRYGFGKQYRLTIAPDAIGMMYSKLFEAWKKNKELFYDFMHDPEQKGSGDYRRSYDRFATQKSWLKFLGRF